MRVLLVGGSGFVGTALAQELLDRGHAVTVLARTPSDDTVPDGVETVAGDVTDYDSIEPAFEGQDVVVNLVALSPLFTPSGGNEMHKRVHLGGTENVTKAAHAHDVRRLVQLSALGADPDGSTAYIRAKGAAEQVVRDSSLDWTIVRPSVVFGDGGEFIGFTKTLTTPYITGLPGGGTTRFQPLWVGDFAPMLADMVEDEQHVNETYELGGPDVLTLAEVATLTYAADGRSLTVLPVPMPLARLGLTLADRIPGIPIGTDQYRSLKFDNTVTQNDSHELGRSSGDLRSLTEYLGVSGYDTPTAGSATDTTTDGGRDPGSWTTASAAFAGTIAWAVVLSGILAMGLITDIWTLADVLARPDALLSSSSVLAIIGTAVLVGGPITIYLRVGLMTPLIGLLIYFGSWVVYGVMSGFGGVRSLYVGFLYGGFALVGFIVVGSLEYLLRSGRSGEPRQRIENSE